MGESMLISWDHYSLQRKAKGQELLDMICQSMNLLEKDYFGLLYEDRHDPRNWLDLDKRIAKFVKSRETKCLGLHLASVGDWLE